MITTLDLALLIDATIAVTIAEGVLLLAFHRLTGRGLAPRDFALNMLSGLCLMLALRCLARDTGAAAVASCVVGAGAAHAADLWRRLRRTRHETFTTQAVLGGTAHAPRESTINAHRSAA